ncbi:MAG: protease inhibitor I42 family protein [Dehalococcoidales bacterium]|nr:protease inhibitor I42 family protein [Dehalococcoidales bacterium]
MKRISVLIVISILLLPLMILGCKSEKSPETSVPALHGGQEAKMIELSTDDFMAQNHITRDIELIRPGSLIVSLGANPTTGFEWGEAEVSDSSVVAEQSHNYVPPQTEGTVVGAPGKDVWVFDSQQAGTATIKMSYSRPWEGGEKDVQTLTINVTVK